MSNLIQEKAYNFSLRVVRLSEFLAKEKHEYVLSKKVLDSGVNISLFVEEAQQAPDSLILFRSILYRIKKLSKRTFC